MLNTIKMDLYRAFKSKSLYITLLIAVFCFIVNITALKNQTLEPEKMVQANTEEKQVSKTGVEVGISIAIEDNFSVDDTMVILFQGGIILLLGTIFCAIFVSTDHSSGFIKNVISRKNYRKQSSISKIIVMAVYTGLEVITSFITVIVGLIICFPGIRVDNFGVILSYLGVQILLQTALLSLCVFACNVIRNVGIAMAFSIFLSAGLLTVIPNLIDRLKLPVTLCDYVLSTLIKILPTQYDNTIYLRAIIVSIVSLSVFLLGSTIVLKRQDIK